MTATFYACPDGEPLKLELEPQLESWDKRGAAAQVRLSRWLDHVEAAAAQPLHHAGQNAAMALTVGLPNHLSLISGGRDLDNFLFPLIHRLGHQRFSTAWAEKVRGTSSLAIGPARAQPEPSGSWSSCSVITTASTETLAFKEQVSAAVPKALIGGGPVELQITYVVSPRRNWASLWKPTIDALGNILGIAHPARPFKPDDDRIVRLGLHRTIDESIGWNIQIRILWREVA